MGSFCSRVEPDLLPEKDLRARYHILRQDVRNDPDNKPAIACLLEISMIMGYCEHAIRLCRTIGTNPMTTKCYFYSGMWAEAIKTAPYPDGFFIQSYLNLENSSNTSLSLGEHHGVFRAQLYVKQGRIDEAISILESEKQSNLYYLFGFWVYYDVGMLEKAEQLITRRSFPILTLICIQQQMFLHNYEKAEWGFRVMLKTKQKNLCFEANLEYRLSCALLMVNKASEARQHLVAAEKLGFKKYYIKRMKRKIDAYEFFMKMQYSASLYDIDIKYSLLTYYRL